MTEQTMTTPGAFEEEPQVKEKKQWGTGSFALLLVLLGIGLTFTFGDFCLGDAILKGLGLPAWSKGNVGVHFTVFYALIFFIPAIGLGIKYRRHRLAKLGLTLAGILTAYILLALLILPV